MKRANTINVRVFVYPGESEEDITNRFLDLTGWNLEKLMKEKINFNVKKVKGFSERTIKIISLELNKDSHCNRFLSRLSELLGDDDKELLLSQEDRLDEHLNFFIRIDKKEWLEGVLELTDSGDCFHIRVNVAAFPRKKDVAWRVLKEIFI